MEIVSAICLACSRRARTSWTSSRRSILISETLSGWSFAYAGFGKVRANTAATIREILAIMRTAHPLSFATGTQERRITNAFLNFLIKFRSVQNLGRRKGLGDRILVFVCLG